MKGIEVFSLPWEVEFFLSMIALCISRRIQIIVGNNKPLSEVHKSPPSTVMRMKDWAINHFSGSGSKLES